MSQHVLERSMFGKGEVGYINALRWNHPVIGFDHACEWVARQGVRLTSHQNPFNGLRKAAKYRLWGDLLAFKTVEAHGPRHARRAVIANLIIPAGSLVIVSNSGWGYKCRTERAFVHSMAYLDNHMPVDTARSLHDPGFKYKAGKIVTPKHPFNDVVSEMCVSGIHFYVDARSVGVR